MTEKRSCRCRDLQFLDFYILFVHHITTALVSQVSDASRRLLEEEEICQSLSNATRKMEADAKKIKEEMAMKEEK